jgi:hypothetical protein
MKRVEELGYQAHQRGMFNEWLDLRSEYIKEKNLEIEEAAEQATLTLEKKLVTRI